MPGIIGGQYDFLIFASDRRLAAQSIPGYFEHAYYLLAIDPALKFGEALKSSHQGHYRC
jgi:hypothetical protein